MRIEIANFYSSEAAESDDTERETEPDSDPPSCMLNW